MLAIAATLAVPASERLRFLSISRPNLLIRLVLSFTLLSIPSIRLLIFATCLLTSAFVAK
jgi:hypothetical protein